MGTSQEVTDDPLISVKVNKALDEWTSPMHDYQQMRSAYSEYRAYLSRKWIFIAVCIIVCFIVAGFALTIGPYNIGFWRSYELTWHRITHTPDDELLEWIVTDLRMRRIVTGVVAGAGLAVAGAVMQSTLMNPLADPYTTGVSSGASFGATLAITSGVTLISSSYGLVINAFILVLSEF